MGLTKYEKETVINFNDADKMASISTSQDWMKRRLKRLAEENPNDVQIKSEDEYTLIVKVPKNYIKKISPPRQMSEEQKNAASKRLKDYWEHKDNENVE